MTGPRTRRIRQLGLTVGLAAVTAVALPGAVASANHVTRATSNLSYQHEVGTGSNHGYGFAAVRITGDQVCFGLRWTNIPTPSAAHIHEAPVGQSGPVVVPLFTNGPGPNSGDGTAWGCVDSANAPGIAEHPEDYYVNLHTSEFPGGAIRGQLVLDAPQT